MPDRIDIEDGKYTIVGMESGWLRALRYGEEWRDLTGDKLVLCMAQEIERLRGEGDWEYQGVPIYEDGSEAAPRSIEACREWIKSDADPNHWIHDEHNWDLPAVVSYRVERRRKAGPWEPIPEGEGDA